MKRCGVYKITNGTKGLSYVGSSLDVDTRIHHHKFDLDKGAHDSRAMQKDFDNGDNFEFSILRIVPDTTSRRELLMLESFYIIINDSIRNGYNKVLPAKLEDVFLMFGDAMQQVIEAKAEQERQKQEREEQKTEQTQQRRKKKISEPISDKKYCEICGCLISDIYAETANYYSHIRVKYCPTCRKIIERRQGVDRVRRYRERKRQQDKARDDQLRLLQEENELLRQRVAQLRESITEPPEELHSAHRINATQ